MDITSFLKKLRLYFKGFKHKRGLSSAETFKQMKEFIQKVYIALQNCLSKNAERSYDAKKMLCQNYQNIDAHYSKFLYWIVPKKNVHLNEKLSSKVHSTQIDSVIILSNGDIAVSGGPLNYEIMIYRNRASVKW